MAFKVGLMDEEETVQSLEMIDKKEEIRYITDHANFEEAAEEIYRQVGDYWYLMDKVLRRIVKRIELDFSMSPEKIKMKL